MPVNELEHELPSFKYLLDTLILLFDCIWIGFELIMSLKVRTIQLNSNLTIQDSKPLTIPFEKVGSRKCTCSCSCKMLNLLHYVFDVLCYLVG